MHERKRLPVVIPKLMDTKVELEALETKRTADKLDLDRLDSLLTNISATLANISATLADLEARVAALEAL